MFENVVVGSPIVEPWRLFAKSAEDWEENEKEKTLFTQTRFLPAIMKEAGVVGSTNEIRRNRPDLVRELTEIDFFRIKWGKKFLYVAVGN